MDQINGFNSNGGVINDVNNHFRFQFNAIEVASAAMAEQLMAGTSTTVNGQNQNYGHVIGVASSGRPISELGSNLGNKVWINEDNIWSRTYDGYHTATFTSAQLYQTTFSHEVLHSMGLEHGQGGGIMNSNITFTYYNGDEDNNPAVTANLAAITLADMQAMVRSLNIKPGATWDMATGIRH